MDWGGAAETIETIGKVAGAAVLIVGGYEKVVKPVFVHAWRRLLRWLGIERLTMADTELREHLADIEGQLVPNNGDPRSLSDRVDAIAHKVDDNHRLALHNFTSVGRWCAQAGERINHVDRIGGPPVPTVQAPVIITEVADLPE